MCGSDRRPKKQTMRSVSICVTLTVALFFFSFSSQAQKFLEGRVLHKDGSPAAAASVQVAGQGSLAVADSLGRYRIQVPDTYPYTLRISSAGYKPVEQQINADPGKDLEFALQDINDILEVVITSRRRSEAAQDVPIAISIVTGRQLDETGSFNVSRIKEFVPTVQFYSSNPRNTTLNIRGLGSTFGLTNDGIDPGVGFYIDGVYYARPAATTLDFIDIDQVEVLRGPQGTLFGKNTTAGAFNITTRAASFTPGAAFEVSYGNYGFIQAKASVTGQVAPKLAGRVSFSGTQRNGLLYNTATEKPVNDLNNLGVRAQLLYQPTDRIKLTLIGDITDQKPDGYAQVFAGVVTTKRVPYRQFENIISDLDYDIPNRNPFDRKIDHDVPWRSGNQLGGVSLNADIKIGSGTLTSTTAWRYWNWDPSNDRDFTGLPVLTRSAATSRHEQFTQEIRYAGDFSPRLSGVVGAFGLWQDLNTDPVHTEESGSAQWRFSQSTPSPLWATPGLFDGYGIKTTSRLQSFGGAVFGQLDWAITDKLHVLPGIRYNYDQKSVDFDRKTYGGLETTDPALLALKRLVYTDQAFATDVKESNFSGQLTMSYRASRKLNAFATVSTSYKPVGVNLGGLPTQNGEVMIDLAEVKPEYVFHYEFGLKTNPTDKSFLNIVFHHTDIRDYQTQVQTPEVGVNRGYLANAERVRVVGVELEGAIRFTDALRIYGAVAYTDAKYVKLTNAPVPLEEVGGTTAFKDISGGRLPGVSKWAGSLGGELTSKTQKLFRKFDGKYFVGFDLYYRSEFSSSPSPSQFLNIEGYSLLNTRIGFRASEGLSVFLWGRNILNKDYFEQLLPAAGSAGHYAAVLGDPRTWGITLRFTL